MKSIKSFFQAMIFGMSVTAVFAQECPPSDTLAVIPAQNLWQMPFINNWQGLELMTWNVKEFPQTGNTISYINEIISDMQPDIIVFQEITDLVQFQALADSLSAYTFTHTDYDGFTNLNLGIALRSDSVVILGQEILFSGYGYEFAWRYPLKVDLQWQCGSSALNFWLIVVHLKCCGDGFNRRLVSAGVLHNHILNEMSSGGQQNIVIAGDFNDEPDDPEGSNSLWPLVNDTANMMFTTLAIINDPAQQSYPWYSPPSFLDHILISSGLFDENTSATIQTIRPDDYMGTSVYYQNVSDHRPVVWRSPLQPADIPTGLVINEIMNNPAAVSDTYGEWFELTNIGAETILIDGLVIRDANTDFHTIQSGGSLILAPGAFIVLGRNGDPALNGGIALDYVYTNINLNNTWDGITIQHPSGIVIDEVYYDNGATFPNTSGASMMLTDPLADNGLGSNWVASDQLMLDGDFGTPGTENHFSGCDPTGDVNGDGVDDVLDLVAIVGYILGSVSFDEDQHCAADMNGDDVIDVSDLVILVNVILQP